VRHWSTTRRSSTSTDGPPATGTGFRAVPHGGRTRSITPHRQPTDGYIAVRTSRWHVLPTLTSADDSLDAPPIPTRFSLLCRLNNPCCFPCRRSRRKARCSTGAPCSRKYFSPTGPMWNHLVALPGTSVGRHMLPRRRILLLMPRARERLASADDTRRSRRENSFPCFSRRSTPGK